MAPSRAEYRLPKVMTAWRCPKFRFLGSPGGVCCPFGTRWGLARSHAPARTDGGFVPARLVRAPPVAQARAYTARAHKKVARALRPRHT